MPKPPAAAPQSSPGRHADLRESRASLPSTANAMHSHSLSSYCADHAERLRSQVAHLKAELVATAAAHEEEEKRLAEVCSGL